MQVYSTINNSQSINIDQTTSNLINYNKMLEQYVKNGFTYKSNQILHKISQIKFRSCPYHILLQIAKIYHLNQFQIIFYTHILNQTSPCYDEQTQIFHLQHHHFPSQIQDIIKTTYQENNNITNGITLGQQLLGIQGNNQEQNIQPNQIHFTMTQLKKIFLYHLVIGYAIKYYLNQPHKVKPYQDYVKSILPNFFPNVFNKWARKYGNTVLCTTPRKINGYYMALGFLQGQQQNNDQKQGQDCQYRNYNQIVQELIKATTQNEQQPGPLQQLDQQSPHQQRI